MENKLHNTILIIDFDSTFITKEALDELAHICLKTKPNKESILSHIKQITADGMVGKLPFSASLAKRLELFKPIKKDIQILIRVLKKNITPSIKRNKAFFKKYSNSIYIVSGGFADYIIPVVESFGISKDHVLANTFIYDKKGQVHGYDTTNPLSQDQGKVKKIYSMKFSNDVVVIGDGITDFQIKQAGLAKKFFAFTENVERMQVVEKADYVLPTLDEFLYQNGLPMTVSYPKNRIRVLLLENIDPIAIQKFIDEGYTVESIKTALDEDELIQKIPAISILGIRSRTHVTRKVLHHAQKLLAIGAFCIGTNQIELPAASTKGIAVFNAPYSNTRSVVELAISYIICLSRMILDKNEKMHKGIWDKSANGLHEVRGKKIGIIGYGNIGSQLSVLCENLGMDVYFYDKAEKLALGNAKKCNSLNELLKKVDIITVHVDGRDENRNLISEKEFKCMKDGVLFLNLSRGFVVDIDMLTKHIKSGKIFGAAVDVFPTEPARNTDPFVSPLQNLPNVILTPHIAGSTEEAQKNIGEFVSQKLIQYVSTGDTTLSVNFPMIQLPTLKNAHRILHIHKNIPGILAMINNTLAQNHMNIEGQYLKTTEEIGYVITDVNKSYNHHILTQLKSINGTIRSRILY